MTAEYSIRPFRTIEEYRDCVALQEATWGEGFSERVAPAILKVAQILGGVSAGAYDASGGLAGFVFGMTGVRDGELVHWSDMLAVRPDARGAGLGAALKGYQRDRVMELGVSTMLWTFDPLQSLNAHVNFAKLGAVSREYVVDMYGQTDSPLHRGIGTDRLIALWPLRTRRVRERLARAERGPTWDELEGTPVALDGTAAGALPEPGDVDLGVESPRVVIRVPSDIAEIMAVDLDLARAWRAATRTAFQHYVDEGFEVRELARGPRLSAYLLMESSVMADKSWSD